jgi:hypothetical protein
MTDVPRRAVYRGDDAGASWFKVSRSKRTAKPKKRKGSGKPEPFFLWLRKRIPGQPIIAAAYGSAVIVAELELQEGNRAFARTLRQIGRECGWSLLEPAPAFQAWPLVDPNGRTVCDMQFWTHRTDHRPFTVGLDASGALWWLTPVDGRAAHGTRWTLKRQAPEV